MDIFEVVQPGPMTTVQDLGRIGYQQYGVPSSGALDDYAFRLGNLLVGNGENAAALEITLFGCQLRALQDTLIAITGADLTPAINGHPAPIWESLWIKRGQLLAFSQLRNGCRSYLAVAGGIRVPEVMKSASTCVRAGIGGLNGRPLCKGDILRAEVDVAVARTAKIPARYIPAYSNSLALRVMLGPQDDYFTEAGISTFLNSEYTVSAQADRMGYRLEGPAIQHKGGADIVSDGIPLGTIQVPGDGLPIILLADRQTIGGYTKIANIMSADMPKIAQAKPGDRIRFQQVKGTRAVALRQKYEQQIKIIKSLLHS